MDFASDRSIDSFGNASDLISKGETKYNFIDFITYADKKICLPYDLADVIKERIEQKKIKCLYNDFRNDTLQVLESANEVREFLGPIGNTTNRREPGNCSLLFFYTKACLGCALAAPHFNALPRYYPQFYIGAIDSFRFHSLNVEYGVVSLPTVLLFHNGRAIRRFNETYSIHNFVKFITAHTNITPTTDKVFVTSDDFRGPLPNKVDYGTDYYLYIAWIFIFFCICYSFTHTKYWKLIVDWMRANWIEASEIEDEDANAEGDVIETEGGIAIETSDVLVEGFSSHTGTSVIDTASGSPTRSKQMLSAGSTHKNDPRNVAGPSGIYKSKAGPRGLYRSYKKAYPTKYRARFDDDDDDDYDDSVD